MTDWQLIESAPKDGTPILVTRVPYDGKRPRHIAMWKSGRAISVKTWWVDGGRRLRYSPTHWMHLPELPTDV
jgi:hypothetical protein